MKSEGTVDTGVGEWRVLENAERSAQRVHRALALTIRCARTGRTVHTGVALLLTVIHRLPLRRLLSLWRLCTLCTLRTLLHLRGSGLCAVGAVGGLSSGGEDSGSSVAGGGAERAVHRLASGRVVSGAGVNCYQPPA